MSAYYMFLVQSCQICLERIYQRSVYQCSYPVHFFLLQCAPKLHTARETAREGEARPKDSAVSRSRATEWNAISRLATLCILQSIMYLASTCLSLSVPVCVLNVFVQEPGGIWLLCARVAVSEMTSCMRNIHPPFVPFCCSVRESSTQRASTRTRAVCSERHARTTPKTRCTIPQADSLSMRCPVAFILGLAYIQRPKPDSSTAFSDEGSRARDCTIFFRTQCSAISLLCTCRLLHRADVVQ